MQYARISKALQVTVKHRIPDLLKDGPKSIEYLASKTKITNPRALDEIMRTLSDQDGWYKENKDGTFENTELSAEFVGDSLGYNCINHMIGDDSWSALGKMEASLYGKNPYEEANRYPIMEYYKKHPEVRSYFEKFIAAFTYESFAKIMKYNFSRFKHIVDVGGLKGGLLHAIKKAYPSVSKLTLFDQPHVVPEKSEGIFITSGSFLEPGQIPKNGDLYILKHIIHDWDDTTATLILTHVQQAMPKEGRVLLIEFFVSPQGGEFYPDEMRGAGLWMMVCGGQERRINEYKELLEKAGLELVNTQLEKDLVFIEAKKKD